MSPAKAKLDLRPELCDGCGRCVRECPPKAMRVGAGYIYVDWERCDGCGQCVEWCDRDAVAVKGGARQQRPPSSPAADPVAASGTPRSWPPSASEARWEWWEAVLPLALMTAVLLLGRSALVASALRAAEGTVWSTALILVWSLVFYGVPLGTMAWLARRQGVSFSRAYGLRTPPFSSLFTVPAAVVVSLAGVVVYTAVLAAFGWRNPQVSLTRLFGPGPLGLALSVVFAVLIGAMTEELLMRGLLLSALRQRLPVGAAIAVSGLVFAAFHVYPWTLLPSALIGMAAGWLFVTSRSLWPAFAYHAAFNLFTVVAQYYLR